MLSCSKEIRTRRRHGIYDLTLEIAEKDFFKKYKSTNIESAKDIINDYLIQRRDLGKVDNIDIYHDEQKHIIQLTTKLDYNN